MTSIRKRLAAASAIVLLLCWVASRFPGCVESLYSERIFPVAVGVLTSFSRLFPFSLGEALMAFALVWTITSWILAAARLARQGGGVARTLARGALRFAVSTLFVLAWGYLFWGLNYARPEASVRLGWEGATAPPDLSLELAALAGEAVDQVNFSYKQAFGTQDRGEAPFPEPDRTVWNESLDSGFAAAATLFDLGPPFAWRLGKAKAFWGSDLLSRFGVSGFYFPWTGEANYNQLTPEAERIHAIAHEKSHQRGIASEDEASFFGFLACALSPSAQVRYAGWLFAQRQLLNQLALVDLRAAREVAARRIPGVLRDEVEIRRFWKGYEGAATEVGAAVNSTYLRAHGVPGGLDSYNRAARLLVLMARERGGLGLDPPPEGQPDG